MKILTSFFAIIVSVLLLKHQASGEMRVRVNEKYGFKTITGSARVAPPKLLPPSALWANAYMIREKKNGKWIPFKMVSVIFWNPEVRQRKGNTKGKTAGSPLSSIKSDDKVIIYLPHTTIRRSVDGANERGLSFSLPMPQFIALAHSRKATLVCSKLKIVFPQSLFVDWNEMADELENKTNTPTTPGMRSKSMQ